jgi:hypothetical protein
VIFLAKYMLTYWIEHGGICLWSANESARDALGYSIANDKLPISKDLISELNALESEYHTYLDWDCPQNPSPWTSSKKT